MKYANLASLIFGMVFTIPSGAAQAADAAGLKILTIPVAHHNRAMKASVMYPANDGADSIFGENPVFFGTPVRENATLEPGKHPVILFSHGWGGNYTRMGWLTAGFGRKRGDCSFGQPSQQHNARPPVSECPQSLDAGAGLVGGTRLRVARSRAGGFD